MQLVVLPGLGQYALAPLLAQEVGVAIMLIQMQLTLVCVAVQFFVLLSAQDGLPACGTCVCFFL
jgi:hypothetical protein